MSPYLPHSVELYRQFFDIAAGNVHGQIRFYEAHEQYFSFLDSEQRFVLLCYYSNALFAAEDYERYLLYAKKVLEMSIMENIQYVDGVDAYLHTLHYKAIAHLRLKSFAEANKTARQLLALAPKNKTYRRLLRTILLLQRPFFVRQAFALGFSALMLWVLFEIFHTLSFEPVYQKMNSQLQQMQRGLLFIASASAIVGLLGHYWSVWRRTKEER